MYDYFFPVGQSNYFNKILFLGESDQRRKLVDIIMSKVPLEMVERIKRRRTEVDFGTDAPNDKTLIKLHRQGHLRSKNISRDLDFEL